MIINGRGQLGEALKKHDFKDWTIYHTWNVEDKSELAQKREYNKFVEFVDNNKDKKILFVSTLYEIWDFYLEYKMVAELYLMSSTETGKIVRLPALLGKYFCDRCKKDLIPYPGKIEIISLKYASAGIKLACDDKDRLIVIHGEWLRAELIYDLIQHGVKE